MKCDEEKPVCGPCAKGNRPCVYSTNPLPTTGNVTAGASPRSGGGCLPTRNSHASPATSAASPAPPRPSFSDSTVPDLGSRPSHTLPETTSQPRNWPATPSEDVLQITSPQSSYSTSTYGAEVAPLRWFGLLAGDAAAAGSLHVPIPSLETLGDAALVHRQDTHPDRLGKNHRPAIHPGFPEGLASHNPSKLLQIAALSPTPPVGSSGVVDERQFWQSTEPIQLKDHENVIFQRFVNGVSLWIDLFDPLKHFSTFVPHLALRNEGLMKAILAVGRYACLDCRSSATSVGKRRWRLAVRSGSSPSVSPWTATSSWRSKSSADCVQARDTSP
jgi:hypothetical protein